MPTTQAADPLASLIHLSTASAGDARLVQPGGGNTSLKLGDALLVKGSGTDLRTIGPRRIHPALAPAARRLARRPRTMSDAEMMRFMATCMLAEGPAPSVETPLHSLLPHRVVAHTHDVATMSLTNVGEGTGERLVGELFDGEIVYVPYVPPGLRARARGAGDGGRTFRPAPPASRWGITGSWSGATTRNSARPASATRWRASTGISRPPGGAAGCWAPREAPPRQQAGRVRLAEVVLPVVRGALGSPERVILHLDDGDDVLAQLGAERTRELTGRGMATPEHLLRAGRLPVWLELDPALPERELVDRTRATLAQARTDYEAYHRRHARSGEPPLDDWAKVILAPGLGMITAFHDKRGAVTANLCYRAVLETIENAEAVDRFEFIPEAQVFEFEHWPLERRKVDEQVAKDRATRLVPRQVAVVIGGGSGIGRSAALRFADEGAHVVVADLEAAAAAKVAEETLARHPGRAIGLGVDVREDASLDALFRRVVLEFGGMDALFYAAGAAAPVRPDRRYPPRGSPAPARRPLPRCGHGDRPRGRGDAAAGAGRVDRRLGVEGRPGPRARRGRLRRQQGGAAPGPPRRRGRAGPRRHPGQRHQRRPGGYADVPPVRRASAPRAEA